MHQEWEMELFQTVLPPRQKEWTKLSIIVHAFSELLPGHSTVTQRAMDQVIQNGIRCSFPFLTRENFSEKKVCQQRGGFFNCLKSNFFERFFSYPYSFFIFSFSYDFFCLFTLLSLFSYSQENPVRHLRLSVDSKNPKKWSLDLR